MKRLKKQILRQTLVLFLILAFLPRFACAALKAKPFSPDQPTVIYTDLLPDDIDAILVMGFFFHANHGRNLVFVTADGKTERKGQALHNLLQIIGLSEARVYAGDPNPEAPEFSYVEDYRVDEAAKFIDALLELKDLKVWHGGDFKVEVDRFVRESRDVDFLLLANPLSFMANAPGWEVSEIRQIVTMGLFKKRGDGSWISSFNTNSNMKAAIAFLEWTEAKQIPTFIIPSDLVTVVPDVSKAIQNSRIKLFDNPAQNEAMARVRKGLLGFRANLTNILGRRYGLLAGHVQLWDPRSEAWLQDLMTTAIAIRPDFVQWQGSECRFDASAQGREQLGQKMTLHEKPWGSVQIATSINALGVAETLQAAYEGVTVLPDFNAKLSIDHHDETPIAMITKSSIDDLGALRMLLGLGHRLKLVVAESTQTPVIAEIYRRILRGLGRSEIEVVAGKGQSFEELAAIPALKLELELIRQKRLGRALLSDAEMEVLNRIDARSLSAEKEIIAFLEKYPKADLMVTSTVEDLENVFTKRPDLLPRLRSLHLMGGWRPADQKKPDIGSLTRNWILAPDKTKSFLDRLAQAGVQMEVYSSHLAGGGLDSAHLPEFLNTLSDLQSQPMEREIDELRKDWNRMLNDLKGGGIDIDNNFGPPLAWMMATRLALGSKAETYYGSRRGRLNLKGTQAEFTTDSNTSVHLVDQPENYAVIDATASYLSRLAHAESGAAPSCEEPLAK